MQLEIPANTCTGTCTFHIQNLPFHTLTAKHFLYDMEHPWGEFESLDDRRQHLPPFPLLLRSQSA